MGLLPFYSINTALLLLALALGYIVCYLAQKGSKSLKITGYIIGTFIITVSAVLILNKLAMDMRMSGRMNRMRGMMTQRSMTPPVNMPEAKLPKAPHK